jgi:pimeloyl-ACP methyl ester carboxylesterase
MVTTHQLQSGLHRLGYRLGAHVAPSWAGKRAADAFGRSRQRDSQRDYRAPLGARELPIVGCPDLERLYVWPGAGPTVLLVHGWGADSSSMTGFLKPLLAQGYRVASFDAPAHGASPGRHTTMTRFVAATRASIEALGDVRFIVAHSLGSIAAIAGVEQTQPSSAALVRGLVLLASPTSLSSVLDRWCISTGLPAPLVDQVYAWLKRQNGVPVTYWDSRIRGRALKMPILSMHDPVDPVVPFREAEGLAAELPNLRLHRIDGVGHSRILSAAAVRQKVMDFLARLDDAEPAMEMQAC